MRKSSTTGVPTRQGFTLVEMLAVLTIIAIVAGITVAAYNGLNRGTSMDAAVATLRTTLSMARQWAITHNEKTYVVFPDDEKAPYGAANRIHVDKALRAYNVYTQSDGYVHQWNYLPVGILFVKDDRVYPKADKPTVFSDLESVKWPDSSGATTSLPCLTYRSDGSLASGNEVEIYLGEGTINADVVTGTVDPPEYRPPAQSSLMGVEVTPFTGGIRIRDYRDVDAP